MTRLLIPADELQAAGDPAALVRVRVELSFDASDTEAAVRWANRHRYNYDDLGDLLVQWALDGAPGASGVGPNIEESSHEIVGL